MGPGKKYRGNMEKVVLSYVKDMEEAMKNARPERVFITHSGSAPEIVDKVRAYLNDLHVFHEILETRAGGVVSGIRQPDRIIGVILNLEIFSKILNISKIFLKKCLTSLFLYSILAKRVADE